MIFGHMKKKLEKLPFKILNKPRKSDKYYKSSSQMRDKTGLSYVYENNEEELDVIHVDNDDNEEDGIRTDIKLIYWSGMKKVLLKIKL